MKSDEMKENEGLKKKEVTRKTSNKDENQNSFFIYLIGETITSFDIINDALKFFKKENENHLKSISLVIIHTLVTYETASELEIELKEFFNDVKSYLIPATEYDMMRYLLRIYDYPSTIIKILGGSWTNTAAISAEVKQSKIYVLNTEFKTSEYVDIKNIISEDILQTSKIFCKSCENLITKFRIDTFPNLSLNNQEPIILYPKKVIPICTNPHCINNLSDSLAYTNSNEIIELDIFKSNNLIEKR